VVFPATDAVLQHPAILVISYVAVKNEICYTFLMLSPRENWLRWAEPCAGIKLMDCILVAGGKAAGNCSGAVVVLGQPFLGDSAHAVGQMLESEEEAGHSLLC
jgi:hypothetical protein